MFITIAYWFVIYNFDQSQPLFKNVNWHGVPILFLMIDFVLNSYRFILKQFISVLAMGFIYMFCINMPYSIGVSPVYGEATDWVNWITYVFIVLGILLNGIVFGCGRLIYVKCK